MLVAELKELNKSLDEKLNAKFEEIAALLMGKNLSDDGAISVSIELSNGEYDTWGGESSYSIYAIVIDKEYDDQFGDMESDDSPNGAISFYNLNPDNKIDILEELEAML